VREQRIKMHETGMSSQLKAPAPMTWVVSVQLVRKCDGPSGWSGHHEKQKKSLTLPGI